MTYQAEVLADSPSYYWRLGEPSGTTAVDSSGNGRDGTHSNVTLAQPGALANDADTAADYNGTTSGTLRASEAAMLFSSQITFECWVNPDNVAAGTRIIGGRRQGGASNTGAQSWGVAHTTDDLQFNIHPTTSSVVNCDALNCLTAGVWQHLVCTYDGVTLKVFVNGVLRGAAGATGAINPGTRAFEVGKNSGLADRYFDGKIDEVALYGSALSAERIWEHWMAGKYRYGSAGSVSSHDIVVAAGEVTADLSPFVMAVNLAHLPDTFWTAARTDLGNVRVEQGGSPIPFDIVTHDPVAKTGLMYVRCALTTATASTITVTTDTTSNRLAATDTYGRRAVWAGYAYMRAGEGGDFDRAGNCTDLRLLTATALGTPDPTRIGWINPNSSAVSYVTGVGFSQVYTMSASWVRGATGSGNRAVTAYSTATSTDGDREAMALENAVDLAMYNTTDSWNYFGASAALTTNEVAGVRVRSSMVKDGTTERYLVRNGVKGVVDAPVTARPTSPGNAFYIGASRLLAGSVIFEGDINYTWLATSKIADARLIGEHSSWENPSGFYTVVDLALQVRSVALGGEGTLAAAVEVTQTVAVALSGAGTLTTALRETHQVATALSGDGDLAASATIVGSGVVSATAALSGTGTLSAVATPVTDDEEFEITFDLVLSILDDVVDQTPTVLTIAGIEGWPDAWIELRVDGVAVFTVQLNTEGDLQTTSVPIPNTVMAGEHLLTAHPVDDSAASGAAAIFTVTRDPDNEITNLPGVDADPIDIPEALLSTGVRRWVLQDLTPDGLGSWVMPHNPSAATPFPTGRALSEARTISHNGQFHLTDALDEVYTWSFSGTYLDRDTQDQLVAFKDLNRRFYLIDHRNRAWTVAVLGVELVPRQRSSIGGVLTDEAGEYNVRCIVFGDEWKEPQ